MLAKLVLCLSLVGIGSALAQSSTSVVTDVRAELSSRLSSQVVTKQRTVKERRVRCHTTPCVLKAPGESLSLLSSATPNAMLCRECDEFEVDRIESYTAPPLVTEAQIVEVKNLAIKESEITSLPDRVIVTTDELVNCAKTPFSAQRTLTQNVQTGFAVTVTRTVGTTNTYAANLSVKLPGDLTVGGNASIATQVSTASANQQSKSETTTQSQTVSLTVPPATKLRVEYRTLVRKLRFPFAAEVLVDGQLDANQSSVARASDLLKDLKDRTFGLEGYIVVDAATAGRVVNTESKTTSLDCVDAQPNEEIRIRSHTTTIAQGGRSSLLDFKKPVAGTRVLQDGGIKSLLGNQPLSYPGAWCHTQACNLPLDGYRKVCYRDENLYCNDCRDEPDSVCAPAPETSRK